MAGMEKEDNNIEIREVWSDNFEKELKLISEVVDKCNYISLDTEFAGHVITHPRGPTYFDYQTMKANVARSKLIQVGLTLTDHQGNNPHVWQFNMKGFDPHTDPCAQTSIQLLAQSGIDFNKNYTDGVSWEEFGQFLTPSGAVMNDDVHWITFHGAYDVGYLVKILRGEDLPPTEEQFLTLVRIFFPNLYDVKYLIKFTNSLYGGLEKVAGDLKMKRVGTAHQAGSDSLVTCGVFMKIKQLWFNDNTLERHSGVLFGMGVDRRF